MQGDNGEIIHEQVSTLQRYANFHYRSYQYEIMYGIYCKRPIFDRHFS